MGWGSREGSTHDFSRYPTALHLRINKQQPEQEQNEALSLSLYTEIYIP